LDEGTAADLTKQLHYVLIIRRRSGLGGSEMYERVAVIALPKDCIVWDGLQSRGVIVSDFLRSRLRNTVILK
jgi:hypothetical protein